MKYLITITTNSEEKYLEVGRKHTLEINSNNPSFIQIFCKMAIQKIQQMENIYKKYKKHNFIVFYVLEIENKCEKHNKQNDIDKNCNICKFITNNEQIIEYHDENDKITTYHCGNIGDFYNHFINIHRHFYHCKNTNKYQLLEMFSIYIYEIKNNKNIKEDENDIKNKQDEQNDISNFLDRAFLVTS
jgi:hypothetical protein